MTTHTTHLEDVQDVRPSSLLEIRYPWLMNRDPNAYEGPTGILYVEDTPNQQED